jgi:hypothetical protein
MGLSFNDSTKYGEKQGTKLVRKGKKVMEFMGVPMVNNYELHQPQKLAI